MVRRWYTKNSFHHLNFYQHPYFEQAHFYNQQWLYAEVIETMSATIKFIAGPPVHWNDEDKTRVTNHFSDFKLVNE